MALLSLAGGTWLRKTILGALLSVAIALGAYAFTSVDHRYVHADSYQLDRLTDSLRQEQRYERSVLKDSILSSKMDEALLRLQQIQCGRRILEGCR